MNAHHPLRTLAPGRRSRPDSEPQLPRDALADIHVRGRLVVGALVREAVHVHQGEPGGSVRGEEGLLAGVDAAVA